MRKISIIFAILLLLPGCIMPGVDAPLLVETPVATTLPEDPSPTVFLTPIPSIRVFNPTEDPSTHVLVEQISGVHSIDLGNTREIRVFLPINYTASSERYPVLYVNDGGDMTGLLIKSTLEALYLVGSIKPAIIVAVYASDQRHEEYGVSGKPGIQNIGASADAYAQFIVKQIIPFINQQYRTLTGPENTAFLGSSLGGLSAFDIAWNYPAVFGKVGVMSGSFWVRPMTGESPEEQQAARLMHQVVRQSSLKPGLKFWFQAGTEDETSDRDANGVIDAVQDTTELMDELALLGYQLNQDMVFYLVAGGEHKPGTWSKALPVFLQWAFPR